MVSVLISCYNVSRFIDRGISAVLTQTYEDCEFIIVDDGSVDDTYHKLKAWAKKDSRIKIIRHQTNMGLGAARNTGLENAKGDFVYFADIDDVVHKDLVEYCVKKISKYQADMLIFGFNAILDIKPYEIDCVRYKERFIESQDQLRKIYVDEIMLARHGCGFVWNKFYRRSFIENYKLRFGNQAIQQDEPFNLNALLNIGKLYISPEVLYDYYIYSSGNNASRYIPERINIYLLIDSLYDNLRKYWCLEDDRVEKFRIRRLWGGIIKVLLYDLYHNDNKMTSKEKNHFFDKIVTYPRLKEVIEKERKVGSLRNRIPSLIMRRGGRKYLRFYFNMENILRKILK